MFQRSCGLCRLYQSFFSSFCGGWGEACGFCVCGFALLYFVLFSNLLQQRHKWFKLQNSLGGSVRPRGETPAWSNSLFTPYFTITSFTYHIIDKQVFAQPDFTYCDPCSCYWRALLVLNLNSTFNISAGRISLPIWGGRWRTNAECRGRYFLAFAYLIPPPSPSWKLTEVQEKSRAETHWYKLFRDAAVSKKKPGGFCL